MISTDVSDGLDFDRRWSEFLLIGVFDNTTVEVQLTVPHVLPEHELQSW